LLYKFKKNINNVISSYVYVEIEEVEILL